jgi:DnaK suppressor protein
MQAHPDADLTPKQVQELSDQLADKRREMIDNIDSFRETIMAKHDCDIHDAGDSARHNEEHRRAATIARHHKETIAEIDLAINRLKEGRFGVSETTGEPIAYERLLAIPWARTSAGG